MATDTDPTKKKDKNFCPNKTDGKYLQREMSVFALRYFQPMRGMDFASNHLKTRSNLLDQSLYFYFSEISGRTKYQLLLFILMV